MKNNPYGILKISEEASAEEIKSAYDSLKKQYSNDRFLEGEVGNDAAKNLELLESAYREIEEDQKIKKAVNDYGSVYGEIEVLIKDNDISSAQAKLDAISERTAEWHFLQSVIFFKKNWHSESKKQLEIAISLDSNNSKYQSSLTKLENVINSGQSNEPPPNSYGAPNNQHNPNGQSNQNGQNGQYSNNSTSSQQMANNSASNCCCQLLCADACCECMGGDLISCC